MVFVHQAYRIFIVSQSVPSRLLRLETQRCERPYPPVMRSPEAKISTVTKESQIIELASNLLMQKMSSFLKSMAIQ